MLKARMTARAKREDRKDARDKRRLENFIDDEIDYILDCYDSATFLVADAQLSILEVAEALQEQYGIAIEKNRIEEDEPIKSFGAYELKCRLGHEVTGTIHLVVTELK